MAVSKAEDWKAIADLLGKIGDEAERLEWPELVSVASDAYDEMEGETNPAIILCVWQQFFFRLLYRVRRYSSPLEFNTVYETTRLENHEYKKYFQVNNYDCKMYLWARKKGFTDYLTNNFFLIPLDKLSDKEKASFEKKCENHYE